MHNRIMLTLAGIAAILAMALSINTASANRLSLSHLTTRAIFNPIEFRGGVGAWSCRLTLEQSFHSATITKTVGALLGYVTGATIQRPCSAGEITILSETLPWHLQYGGFTGTLPQFRGLILNMLGLAFRVNESVFGISCLARSTQERPFVSIAEGIEWERHGNGIIRTLVADQSKEIPCGSFAGRFGGTATVTESAGSTNVLIRLI